MGSTGSTGSTGSNSLKSFANRWNQSLTAVGFREFQSLPGDWPGSQREALNNPPTGPGWQAPIGSGAPIGFAQLRRSGASACRTLPQLTPVRVSAHKSVTDARCVAETSKGTDPMSYFNTSEEIAALLVHLAPHASRALIESIRYAESDDDALRFYADPTSDPDAIVYADGSVETYDA